MSSLERSLGWIPDPTKDQNRRQTAAVRKYRQAFMAKHDSRFCGTCRWNNSDHCVNRAQLFAWRGTGECYEKTFNPQPVAVPAFNPRTIA